jgi:hypothetical protein
MRDNLLGRLCMLEDLTSDAGTVAALQRLTTRLTTINRAPPIPESLSMSSYSIDIDSLPSSGLDGCSDELLVRISRMSIGDAVNVYRGFVPKSYLLVSDLISSSDPQSACSRSLSLINRYHDFILLWATNPNQGCLFTLNLITGQEEEPSDDWFMKTAMKMPVNAEFAQLVITAQSFIAHVSLHRNDKPLTTIHEVAAALSSFASSPVASFAIDPENEESLRRHAEIDAVLNRFERVSRSMISVRTLMTFYLQNQVIQKLGPQAALEVFLSGWPFALPRGMKVVEFYLRRPEVQSALSDFRVSRLISTTFASLQGDNSAMPHPEKAECCIQIQHDPAFESFAVARIEAETLNPQAECAVNPESLDMLLSLTRSSSDEVSKNSSGSDRLKAENVLANPVESMLSLLASNEDGLSANGTALSPIRPRPLSEPINLGIGPDVIPQTHRGQSLLVQSDLPLEDMLLMACDRAWGSRARDSA